MAVRNRIQVRRGYSMGYVGSPIPSGNTDYSYDPVVSYQWTGDKVLYEGEIGYEVDTGKFKIGRKDPVTGNLIIWENLDYGGGGTGGTLIPGSGVGIYINASGDDTIYSILTNTDNNLSINEKQLSTLIAGTTGTYYELGLAESLSNIDNITISGDLSAASGDFSGGVNIGGNLTVSGSSISFDAATITLVNLTATSGNFTNALTVNGTGVSLEGHGHAWSDIDISGSGFCEDVGDCVNTQLVGSSGVQLIYSSGNNTLRVALSGEALAQHLLNSTGFVARSGSETYVTRSIVGGSNIAVTNGDGLLGNPTITLSGTLTGLTSVTATTFSGDLSGNASSASQVATIKRDTDSNTHYLTFVDSNNTSATNETVYTASGIKYIPSTDTLIVGNLSGVTIDGTASEADTVKTLTKSDGGTYYLTFVDSDNNSPGAYEAVYTDAGIVYNPSTNALTITGDITASGATINNNLVVGGDLTVNGTTVTANVDSMVVEDPIITLGKPSGTIAAENKDRGVEFVYPSGTSAIAATGFFGFDKSATEFIAARDVTINGEIVTVNNSSYLDARFNDIDGSTITASTQFSGPGSGLTGIAGDLTVGLASGLVGGSVASVVYQTDTNETEFLTIGTPGQFLIVNSEGEAIVWHTLSYSDIGGTPTIGDATLTFSVSGSGLSIGTDTSFTANSTTAKTFSVTSNATPANSGNTIVSRDTSGNFSAGTITANLTGTASTATSATNINISSNSSTDTTTYLVVVGNNATGDQSPFIDPGLYYNANTNVLTTTQYNGQKVSLSTTSVETSFGVNYNADQKFSVVSSGILLLGTHVDSTSAPFRISNDTVTHGIWSGTAIAANKGGTGQTSYAVGDILYANTTSTLAKLADVATGNVLLAGGVNTAPSWGKVGLTTHVSGTLPVSNGGTGATTLTGALIGNGTSAVSAVSSTTPYAVFRVNSAGNGYEFSVVIDGGTP